MGGCLSQGRKLENPMAREAGSVLIIMISTLRCQNVIHASITAPCPYGQGCEPEIARCEHSEA